MDGRSVPWGVVDLVLLRDVCTTPLNARFWLKFDVYLMQKSDKDNSTDSSTSSQGNEGDNLENLEQVLDLKHMQLSPPLCCI